MGYYSYLSGKEGRGGAWGMPLFKEKPLASMDDPVFMLLVMTGTWQKFFQALKIFHVDTEKVIPARSIAQFAEAGLAKEPVSHDPEFLIFGKQKEQRVELLTKLKKDDDFRSKYDKERIITTLNDINTTVAKRSLTKTRLQKEGDLGSSQYEVLIRASMKYLLASTNNLLDKNEMTWEQLTANYENLCSFDKKADRLFVAGKTYSLPVDFQSIDAFEILDVDAPKGRDPKLKSVGPRIAVLHQSFANIQFAVDADGKMSKFDNSVKHYMTKDRENDRCPLGIYWADLFNSMVVAGMDVGVSVVGHKEPGVNLRERYLDTMTHSILVDPLEQSVAWQKFEEPMAQLELNQNGFGRESFKIALEVYSQSKKKDTDKILFVRCKPATEPYYEWKNAPSYLN